MSLEKNSNYPLHINQTLAEIDELLLTRSADEAYTKYSELVAHIENDEYQVENELKAKVYTSFADFLFRLSEYTQYFRTLIKVQNSGYSIDNLENVLWEAFIEPNTDEFRSIYNSNIKFLTSNKYLDTATPLSFEELPYWLLPTEQENHFFMYDKQQKLIKEEIDLYSYQKIQSLPDVDAFSDYLLYEDWNLNIILTCTNVIRTMKKKSYIVINDMGKFLSSIQGALLNDSILSDVYIFDQLASFQEYFIRTGQFLPRNAINLVDQSQVLQDLLAEIHQHRLKRGNRKGDQVLLSICIPTHNRGHRAFENVMHLLQSYYDEEIEIVVSNNATTNETVPYYDKIREINDTRLTYFQSEENVGFPLNLCKVSELSQGQFILLTSDEDLVNLDVLDKILNILRTSKNLSMIRTSSARTYRFDDKAAPAGEAALKNFMFQSHYMSGMILNNKYLSKHGGIDYLKKNLDTNLMLDWFPHMYWEIFLCQYGEVRNSSYRVILEGPVDDKIEYATIDGVSDLFAYRRLESRFEQHRGTYRIFEDLEVCQNDFELFRDLYLHLCHRTFSLILLSIDLYYSKTDKDILGMLKQTFDLCVSDEFNPQKSDRYMKDIQFITDTYLKFFRHTVTNVVHKDKLSSAN
ncbi:MAG: glycosyltransferase [Candidatus Cohnella colombiensis]|uniref:Glycosyltransferase n=1 Tax=Candidatus Cohnella colombiensis TaxID=3121368 RepID=A0AA95EUZ7_9BACL|nr:MAG: glycosyltransferase [Cohnella sp.]